MTIGGHQVPGEGTGDDGFEEEGYDESQRAEILEVTRDGPSDGTILTDLNPDIAADDDEDEDELEMEDGEIGDDDDEDETDQEDDDEDDLQEDFEAEEVDDDSLTDKDDAALRP